MSSFQIHTPEGKKLTMGDLDAEAAAFWNKEVDSDSYADPSEPRKEGESSADYYRRSMLGNWYDIIGYNIANQGYAMSGWSNVVHTILSSSMPSFIIDTKEGYADRPVKLLAELEIIDETKFELNWIDNGKVALAGVLLFVKPYLELINHWQSKGYKPVQIKE